MKYFCIALLALASHVSSPMKQSQTWQDLINRSEPLLAHQDNYKITDSDDAYSASAQDEPSREDTGRLTSSLATEPKRKIPIITCAVKVPEGERHADAYKWSAEDFPETQSNPIQSLQEHPHLAAIRGKVALYTLLGDGYVIHPTLYTDFKIGSVDLDPTGTQLVITGTRHKISKILIYRLHEKGLEKIGSYSASSKLAFVALSPQATKILIGYKTKKKGAKSVTTAKVHALPSGQEICNLNTEIGTIRKSFAAQWVDEETLNVDNEPLTELPEQTTLESAGE